MRKAGWFGLGFLVFAAVLIFAKDLFVKMIVEQGVAAAAGVKLSIRSLKIGILRTDVRIQDLRVFNPPGFSEPVMADIPEIYVDYRALPLLKGEVHLPELRLHFEKFVVAKNSKGRLNVAALKAVSSPQASPTKPGLEQKPGSAPGPGQPASKQKAGNLRIDRFSLRIGRILYTDDSKAGPSAREYPVDLNAQFHDISDLNQLVRLIVLKVMVSTPLARLTQFDAGNLENSVRDILSDPRSFAENAGNKDRGAGTKPGTPDASSLLAT